MVNFYKIFRDIIKCFVVSCATTLLMFFFDENAVYTKENARIVVWSIFAVLVVLFAIYVIIFEEARYKNVELPTKTHSPKETTVLTNKDTADFNKKISSIHEAGHAVMSYLKGLEQYDAFVTDTNPHIVSVFKLMKAEELRDFIMMLYAGAAAEEIFYGSFYSGGVAGENSDFKKAVNYMKIYLMMTRSDISKACLDEEVSMYIKELSNDIYNGAMELLSQNRQVIERIANELEVKGTLTTKEIKEIVENINQKMQS